MDIIIFVLVLLAGFSFTNSFKKGMSLKELSDLKKLWIFHVVFGIYFCFFMISDSRGYWGGAKLISYKDFIKYFTKETGSYFMLGLNYYPSNVLGLSYFSGTMIYTFIGFVGLTFFYVITLKLIPNNSKFQSYNLFPLLFFLPNLHFWSCSTGKDTLLFFCIASLSYSLLKPISIIKIVLGSTSLLLAYFVRPHMAFMMLSGYGLAFIFSPKVSFLQRLIISSVFIYIAISILPKVLEIDQIQSASVESFDQFSEAKASVLSRSNVGTAIDISSYPFPLKVFSFLYRPFFFDINGLPAILASFENLLLFILTIKIIRNKPFKTFINAPYLIKAFFIFLIIGTIAFSNSLGNVGIMIRMRNMFLPGLLIFFLWSFSYEKERKKRKPTQLK